jgi:D-amino peptidase
MPTRPAQPKTNFLFPRLSRFDHEHPRRAAALARLPDFKPFVLKKPIALEISHKNYTPAEAMSFLRVVERVDSHTIRFTGQDMEEVTDLLEFARSYSQESTP